MRRGIFRLVHPPTVAVNDAGGIFRRTRSDIKACSAVICIASGLILAAPVVAVGPSCGPTEISASDPAASDQFGFSVAMSGDVCIVGARLDDAAATNSGSAYIFRRDSDTGAWTQEAKLVPADGASGDEFGYSVAIFSNAAYGGGLFGGGGDIAIIGARNDDDHGSDSGAAYVFQKVGDSSWNQVAKLSPSDGAAADHFGFAVAISGDFALVSARDDDAPSTNSGSTYAYRFDGANWAFQTKLTASDAAANDQFGQSLGMDFSEDGAGAVAIIGAWHDDIPTMDAGSAYIFRFRSRTQAWSQGAKLTASDASVADEFGFAVAISITPETELALIGARFKDSNGSNSGAAYIFRHVGSAWDEETKLAAADANQDDQFGGSVSLAAASDTALIGAWHDDQQGSDAGAAYVFRKDQATGSWYQTTKLAPMDIAAGDTFGASVSLSVDRAVISAHQTDAPMLDAGAAYALDGVSGTDANGNGVPDACDLPGDINGDGMVNIADLQAVLAAWGLCPPPPANCPADFDGNGIVNSADLLYLLNHWT